MNTLPRILVTTFGLGYMRPASGTWGSLPPAVVGAGLVWFGRDQAVTWYGAMGIFTLAFSLICVRFGSTAEALFGKKDPSRVVADETAGMALTLLFIPAAARVDSIKGLGLIAAAFVLFRITDILKLWPANGLQRVGGGWGILLDDLVAAVQAGVVVWGLSWLMMK